jgi:23S rRNA pseudouridine1911/1915/1917 synthase
MPEKLKTTSQTPQILFEDQHLMVISKPAGLLSQGEKTGDDNLVDWAREHVKRNYVGLVHRLDRNTSGAMVLAKRTKSAQRLTDSLQKGELKRSYLAWVQGELREKIRWRHFLLKDEKQNRSRVVAQGTPGARDAKEAALEVRPLMKSMLDGKQLVTLVEFVLETGRSHQIRAQAAHEKHALIGDFKYGGIETASISRPALHSYHLEFPHPMSRERLAFSAPLPEDFIRIGGSSLSDIDQLLRKSGSEMFGEARSPE